MLYQSVGNPCVGIFKVFLTELVKKQEDSSNFYLEGKDLTATSFLEVQQGQGKNTAMSTVTESPCF